MTAHRLLPGDAAPWIKVAALDGNPGYMFHSAAGRAVLMLFAGTLSRPEIAAAYAHVAANRALFDDDKACFFGVSIDPADAAEKRIAQDLPGIRWFLDFDRQMSTDYRAVEGDSFRPHWLLLDRQLRVVATADLAGADAMFAALRALIAAEVEEVPPPILIVPRVFEPELCRELIDYYARSEPEVSGFMREVDGQTRLMLDPAHKQRTDCVITDETLRNSLAARMKRFLAPQIAKAFQFEPTRVERYIVARYDAGHGHFRPHRDNTTKATAHRRFACTINLNAEDYDGGDLRFPEFGRRSWRAPTGGAIIFSCSLLHEATPMVRGSRYAFLPFFYDEAGAALREENLKYLAADAGD